MATVNEVTDAAYRKIGIKSPTSTEDTYALEAINNMISQWGGEFLVPYFTKESFTLTAGTSEYTIGSGGDFDTVRPLSIDQAYLRVDTIDYHLKVISGKQEGMVRMKSYEGRPEEVAYLPEYSLGKILFDCEPDDTYTVYFTFRKNFTRFTAITDTISLPDEYFEALTYNLTIRLAEDNSIQLPQSIYEIAGQSKAVISRLFGITRPAPRIPFAELNALTSTYTGSDIHWES